MHFFDMAHLLLDIHLSDPPLFDMAVGLLIYY